MIVGVVGDKHLPFEDERYLDFCSETFEKFNVKKIVDVGDNVDNHCVSFHETDPNGFSAGDELKLAKRKMKDWMERFENVTLLRGNHDLRIEKQFLRNGIPKEWQRKYEDVFEFFNGWTLQDWEIIDGVLYSHGDGFIGKTGALDKAIYERRSCVIGHSHGFAGCQYQSNGSNTIFGLNVGCGVDNDKYAFAYGRYFKNKPVLSCGIVEDGENAFCVKMKEGKYGFNA